MPCFPSCIATEIRCTLFSDLFITSVKDIKVYKFYATCTNYYSNRGKYVRKWNFQVREEVLIFDLTFLVRVITDFTIITPTQITCMVNLKRTKK